VFRKLLDHCGLDQGLQLFEVVERAARNPCLLEKHRSGDFFGPTSASRVRQASISCLRISVPRLRAALTLGIRHPWLLDDTLTNLGVDFSVDADGFGRKKRLSLADVKIVLQNQHMHRITSFR